PAGMIRFAPWVVLCLACSSSSSGGSSDAGGTPADTGPTPDAGVAADLGVAPDAATTGEDRPARADEVGADATEAADTKPATLPDGATAAVCSTRKGGALVTFGVCDPKQFLTVWITNGAFIDEAIAKKGMHSRIPVMDLVAGPDCDPRY